ncbi:MAG TPA: S4 domain-containing protein, partial [Steroidobacteraceae bacterium]
MAARRLKRVSIANSSDAPRTTGDPEEFRSHALTLAPEAAGLRFDQALAQALPQYSRARLRSWIEAGSVAVEGRPLRPKDKVLGGEQVRIEARLP